MPVVALLPGWSPTQSCPLPPAPQADLQEGLQAAQQLDAELEHTLAQVG